VPLLLLVFFCSAAFAEHFANPFANEFGTNLIAMPTYTYSRAPGALGLKAEEEIWRPDKWKNRQIFNRFVPIMDWKIEQNSLWFYTGNELGDELWQELSAQGEVPNSTPMLYGGFSAPLTNGFYAMAEFNQIDHFSEATFDTRRERINSQKFSWFGENLPAYSGIFGGIGYNGTGKIFKSASFLTGSEYAWAWDEKEWIPIRISPRIEGNANFYFMENEVELTASNETYQIQDSAEENRSNLGMRLKGKNTGGGFYARRTDGKEHIIVWSDFNHNFLQVFTNKGFIAFNSDQNQGLKLPEEVPLSYSFADSLEYKIDITASTDLTIGVLLQQIGVKLYGETTYENKPMYAKTKAYKNYTEDFESIGFDSELAYKSKLAEVGVAYSREFFEYYREAILDDIKPAENMAKMFVKYRFLQNLSLTHEWIYRDLPEAVWLWNFQAEQRLPKLNTSLYAVLLNAISKDKKELPFGGINAAKFYCGFKASL
jgi:hypothetical protein